METHKVRSSRRGLRSQPSEAPVFPAKPGGPGQEVERGRGLTGSPRGAERGDRWRSAEHAVSRGTGLSHCRSSPQSFERGDAITPFYGLRNGRSWGAGQVRRSGWSPGCETRGVSPVTPGMWWEGAAAGTEQDTTTPFLSAAHRPPRSPRGHGRTWASSATAPGLCFRFRQWGRNQHLPRRQFQGLWGNYVSNIKYLEQRLGTALCVCHTGNNWELPTCLWCVLLCLDANPCPPSSSLSTFALCEGEAGTPKGSGRGCGVR